jgi:PhzF family phenazine biosynthesis protein
VSHEIHQVDAFSAAPFRGNPAAVVPLDAPAAAAWMQSVAIEMNLSETAFVAPHGGGGFSIRWFTPRCEVPLCGHATLASAHVLWETGRVAAGDRIVFHSASGELRAARGDDGITLDFPAQPTVPGDPPECVRRAMGDARWIEARQVTRDLGEENWLLVLPSEDDVRRLDPDLGPLRPAGSPGLLVTAKGDTYDFVSRYFVPWAGIDEDPVTGSAHCVLTPYWAEKTGRNDFRAYQASARGGELRCRLTGDRVFLTGRAVTTLRGRLLC